MNRATTVDTADLLNLVLNALSNIVEQAREDVNAEPKKRLKHIERLQRELETVVSILNRIEAVEQL